MLAAHFAKVRGELINATEAAVRGFVRSLSPDEKTLLLEWARRAREVTNDTTLSRTQKIERLKDLGARRDWRAIFLRLFAFLRKHAWENRSWPSRMAVVGLGIGVTTSGAQWAGVAFSGTAIGVPIFLLTAAGGALLGTVIAEIERSLRRDPK